MKDRKNKTILKTFMIPLILIILIQTLISAASVIFGNSLTKLSDYAVNILSQTVETRKVMVENTMVQSWSNISETADFIDLAIEDALKKRKITIEQFLADDDAQNELLNEVLEPCILAMRKNLVTGTFVILGNPDGQGNDYDLNGMYFRSQDPYSNPSTYSGIMMVRGSSTISKKLNIPLDMYWHSKFNVLQSGARNDDNFFYKPLEAALENPYTEYTNLGYWSKPFCLEGKYDKDSYEMITYTIPLVSKEGNVYGVMGVEISMDYLETMIPATDYDRNETSGYIIGQLHSKNSVIPIASSGAIASRILESNDTIELKDTKYEGVYDIIGDEKTDSEASISIQEIHLYNSNTPFENEVWVIGGLQLNNSLFGFGRNLIMTFLIGLTVAFAFGILAMYVLAKQLTRPIVNLAKCIRSDSEVCLDSFARSNITEIDALYDEVDHLTKVQEKNKEILMQEKERYMIALQSSNDILFSCNYQDGKMQLRNMNASQGKVEEEEVDNWEEWLMASDLIHPDYRYDLIKLIENTEDTVETELKARMSNQDDYIWLAAKGKVSYDNNGKRAIIIGVLQNIDEMKKEELKKQTLRRLDPVTGLYRVEFGKKLIKEKLANHRSGCLVMFDIDDFYQINDQYGIVFGDTILEEIGKLLLDYGDTLQERYMLQSIVVREGGDEILLWVEGRTAIQVRDDMEEFKEKISELYPKIKLSISISGGITDIDSMGNYDKWREQVMQALAYAKKMKSDRFIIYRELEKFELPKLKVDDINGIASIPYREKLNIVSLVFNFFDKGRELENIIPVLLLKLGRHFNLAAIAMVTADIDFRTTYTLYSWENEGDILFKDEVCHFDKEEFETLYESIGNESRSTLDLKEATKAERRFLFVKNPSCGISVPMYDNGRYTGSLVIIQPKGAEEMQKEHKKEIQEITKIIETNCNKERYDMASRAKSDFLSRMSHEIRTPMNAIMGMTSIALTQKDDPEKVEESLNKIGQSSTYLLNLINDILDMSKIESGKMRLSDENHSMNEALAEIVNLIQPQADEKGLQLVTDFYTPCEWLRGDKLHLNQVIVNLLGNAIKFTPEGGKIIFTVHQKKKPNDEVEVFCSVKDTGIGISEESREMIFNSFEQANDGISKQYGGTGLGLSISSRLVNMMGGVIELSSKVGEGSDFFFRIMMKVGKSEKDTGHLTGSAGEDLISDDELTGKRILLVDDNELNIEIAKELLEMRGFVIEVAYDGKEAISKYESNEAYYYDMILMDIRMPVMNGLEATKQIRKMNRPDANDVPIVAMTANAFDDDIRRSLASGMDGHLSKPIDMEILINMLKQVMGKRKDKRN